MRWKWDILYCSNVTVTANATYAHYLILMETALDKDFQFMMLMFCPMKKYTKPFLHITFPTFIECSKKFLLSSKCLKHTTSFWTLPLYESHYHVHAIYTSMLSIHRRLWKQITLAAKRFYIGVYRSSLA